MSASPLRKVIHVDMDAFYASVEQRDHPALRGRPVVVGGTPTGRGVVAAASYEAREFGIHSAQPAAQARRLCPDAVFLRPDMDKYRHVSRQIHEVFRRHTDLIQPLSLDEAYLDVTTHKGGCPSATWVARAIRREIKAATGLTASAGVSATKFLAKVASDMDKPDGLTVVPPDRVPHVLATLPVRRVPGIGAKTEARCHRLGIDVVADFLRFDLTALTAHFGRSGPLFHAYAQGIDPRPVLPPQPRKSCGIEDTFPHDLTAADEVWQTLGRLAQGLAKRLEAHALTGRTVTVKIRYADFSIITRRRTLPRPIGDADALAEVACDLADETLDANGDLPLPIRLLGITVSHFDTPPTPHHPRAHQLELFTP